MDDKIIPINQPTKSSAMPPSERASKPLLPLSQDGPGMQRTAKMLTDMFETLNVFGRKTESLKVIIPLFLSSLGRYPVEAVHLAFDSWLAESGAFPTPFDILNILRFDPDESVEDPNGYQGWYVKRSDLKPGDQGYIKPPALWREISAAVAAMNAPHGRMIGDIASGIIRQIERRRQDD